MIAWFNALSARERLLLLTVIPLTLLVAGYRLAWVPLQDLNAQYVRNISDYRLVIDTAALAAQTDRPAPRSAPPQTPIAQRITRSSEAAGLALRRIEPAGSGMRVMLDDVPFASVLRWLADLEQAHDITATSVEIDRRPEPGMVSARLLLDELR